MNKLVIRDNAAVLISQMDHKMNFEMIANKHIHFHALVIKKIIWSLFSFSFPGPPWMLHVLINSV